MLSEKERELVMLLAQGFNQQEIAYRTGEHINTVNTRVAEMKIKMDADNLFVLGMKCVEILKPAV